jgi:hypothetical protein
VVIHDETQVQGQNDVPFDERAYMISPDAQRHMDALEADMRAALDRHLAVRFERVDVDERARAMQRATEAMMARDVRMPPQMAANYREQLRDYAAQDVRMMRQLQEQVNMTGVMVPRPLNVQQLLRERPVNLGPGQITEIIGEARPLASAAPRPASPVLNDGSPGLAVGPGVEGVPGWSETT